MTLILSLIVLSLMFVSLFLLMMIDKSSRSGQLRQCADQLQLSYQPFASLSSQMRDARFQIIEIGQFRNFRHLLEGEYGVEGNKRQLNLFDYSLVSQEERRTRPCC